MKIMLSILKRLLLPLVVAIAGLADAADAGAVGGRLLRVGFYQQAGFNMESAGGVRGGFDYEYLQMLAVYGNFRYEYCGNDKSWAQNMEMLERGEIDILPGAQVSEERALKFDFSDPTGTFSCVLSVRSGDTRYLPCDYAHWNGIRIGMARGIQCNEHLSAFARKNGFDFVPVMYEYYDGMAKDLQRGGRIDAILTESLRYAENEWILDSFSSTPFRIMIRKGNPELLSALNAAIAELNRNEATAVAELYNKYFPSSVREHITFSLSDRQFIWTANSERRVFTALLNPDCRPFSYWDGGKLSGVFRELGDVVFSRSGLAVRWIMPETRDEYEKIVAERGADIIFGARLGLNEAESAGYVLTRPYFSSPVSGVSGNDVDGVARSIAAVRGELSADELKSLAGPGCPVFFYDSIDEAVGAVVSGKNSVFYIYSGIAELVARNSNHRLNARIVPGMREDFTIAVKTEGNSGLAAVLAKASSGIEVETVRRMLDGYAEPMLQAPAIKDYFYSYPEYILAFAVVTALLIVGVLSAVAVGRRRAVRRLNAAYDEVARLRAEQSLALRLTGDGVILTDADGVIGVINPEAEKITGWTAEKAVGKKHGEVVRFTWCADSSPAESPLAEALESGKAVESGDRLQVMAATGGVYHVSSCAAPIREASGRIVGAAAIFRDVTGEYAQREHLEHAIKLLDYALELNNAAAFSVDVERKTMEGTGALDKLWPTRDGRRLSIEEWVHPEDRQKYLAAFVELIRRKSGEMSLEYRGGEKFQSTYRVRAGLYVDGGVSRVVGLIQDVTELTELQRSCRMLGRCLDMLFHSGRDDDNFNDALGVVCEFMGASRAFLAEYDTESGGLMAAIEHPASWKVPIFNGFQNGGLFSVARFREAAGSGGMFAEPDMIRYWREHPNRNWDEFLFENRIKSVCVLELTCNGSPWGIIGVSYEDDGVDDFSGLQLEFMHSAVHLFELVLARKLGKEENQLILDNLPVPVALFDTGRRIIRVNNCLVKMAGKSSRDILEQPCHEVFACGRGGSSDCVVSRTMRSLTDNSFEYRIGDRTFKVEARPVLDARGKLIRVLESAMDVTDWNAMLANEKILNNCLQSVAVSDDMLRTLMESLESVCRHIGADRAYVMRFNSEDETISCVAESSADGRNPLFAGIVNRPYSTDPSWESVFTRDEQIVIADVFREGAAVGLAEDWMRFLHAGNIRSLYANRIQFKGRLWGYVGLAFEKRTFTLSSWSVNFLSSFARILEILLAHESARRQITDTMRRLQEADRVKSVFLAGVSHELRTPLNAIIGFSGMLRDGKVPDNERGDYLNCIHNSGAALLAMINDVIDMSQLESGQLSFNRAETDFPALIRAAGELFSAECRRKRIVLKYELDDMPVLLIDAERLRQMLVHLIGNAVKWTDSGWVAIRAGFRPDAGGDVGRLSFSVADTGHGIGPEEQRQLFDPLAYGQSLRGGVDGTALGFAIIRRVLAEMNGSIGVESAPERGSEFKIEIRGVCCVAAPRGAAHTAGDGSPVDGVPISILLVDDIAMNLKVQAAMLKRLGAEVVSAGSGAEALAILGRRSVDGVLTDLWMPGMNGAELALALRGNPLYSGLFIAAVTADVENGRNFDMSVFDTVLTKPVMPFQLAEICREIGDWRSGSGGSDLNRAGRDDGLLMKS
ncbi:MAG: transporter substrate-binding domain-containing protein [Victivallaceae bacterium]|nr:transporter substrate-binding domain-containing protein [Victivallaceae bacterium]